MKRYTFLLILILFIILIYPSQPSIACAEEVEKAQIEQNLEESINDTLYSLDFEALDRVLDSLDEDNRNIFGEDSFFKKVNKILSGDVGDNFGSFLLCILDLFFGNIVKYIPVICIIVGIAILSSLIGNIRSNNDYNLENIVNFVCFALIVVVLSVQCFGLLNEVQNCINLQKMQMDGIFPILLTMLASIGGTVSVGVFQSSTAILANVVLQAFTFLVVPLFLTCFVFSVLGNLVQSVKLDKFVELVHTVLKWLIGIIFGVFSLILTVQGIVAGNYDGMSIKASKFALKSYIPVLGGYLADGFNFVAASGVLIKNSLGLAGLILILSTIIPTFVRIIVLALLLKFASAIVEPMGSSKVCNFLNQISKLMFYLVGILLVVGFMYVLTLGLIMCVANVF